MRDMWGFYEEDKLMQEELNRIERANGEQQGYYDKYVVFRHPQTHFEHATAHTGDLDTPNNTLDLEKVEGTIFVLKLDTDHHARVAAAAYAWSCRSDDPQLSQDLRDLLELVESK